MALSIKNPVAEELARELARATGKGITDVVIEALQSRLATITRRRVHPDVLPDIAELQALVRAQPDRDPRTPDEILGYDEFGLPS